MRCSIYVQTALIALTLGGVAATRRCSLAEEGQPIDYVRDIKPIFTERCASCHGGLKQSGGLRLDTAAAMLKGGDSGPAVRAGHAAASLLAQVLRGKADFQMPPEGQGTPPDATEVSRIVHWIDQGAVAPPDEQPQADPKTYWSYQPPTDVMIPAVSERAWNHNAIDTFVAAQYEARGLQPQPLAEPAVQLRRLFVDLVGYPPPRQQLADFLADPSEAAYERIVDDLLARPQYGERWGRHWMDVWRYSDWYGRRPSNEIRYSQRHIWRWRDWIIRSLNEDKGYDRMLTEMLAADEFAPQDTDVLAATGFLGRNWYKFDKNTWLFETVEHTSRGLMAMTMQCCRCHDHKYDPIAQQEYYQFRAFFEPHGFRIDPVTLDPVTLDLATEVDNGNEKVLVDGLARAYDKEPEAPTYLFQRGDDRRPDKDNPLQPTVPRALGREGLRIQPVALPASSYLPQINSLSQTQAMHRGQAAIATAEKKRDEVQREISRLHDELAQIDKSELAGDAAPFIDDNFATLDAQRWRIVSGQWSVKANRLTESQVTSFATLVSTEDHPRNFIARARYRKLQPGNYRSVGFSFDRTSAGKDSQDVYTSKVDSRPQGSVQAFHRVGGKATYPAAGIKPADIEVGKWVDLKFAVRESQLTVQVNGQVKLEYVLPRERTAGRFAVWVHSGAAEFEYVRVTPIVPSVGDLEAAIAASRHQLQLAELAVEVARAEAAFQTSQIVAERLRLELDVGNIEAAAIAAHRCELQIALAKARLASAHAKRQATMTNTAESRGEAHRAQAAVTQAAKRLANPDGRYTRFENQFPTASSGRRLALARWLTRPDHPRTSRVAVNHIWLRHFGEALVTSTDNFGMSGQRPSHPQLLDWLANELVSHDWSMKHLHKLIVTSRVYRLASAPAGDLVANQEIDPGNVYLWRANSRRMEAEAVRDSLLAVSAEMEWTPGGPDLAEQQGLMTRRRSLYFRTTPDNQMQMLALFDQANPDECYRRQESVVPQQALALMNSRLAIDLSRLLAAKLQDAIPASEKEASERYVMLAFQTILSRNPSPREIDDCLVFLKQSAELMQQRDTLQAFPASATKPTVAASTDPHQRARESLVHVLFNHNEFVTIR